MLHKVLSQSREAKDPRLVPECLTHLGEIALMQKESAEAQAYLLEALQLALEAQAMAQMMETLLNLGKLLIQRGQVMFGASVIAHVLHHTGTSNNDKVEARAALETLTPHMFEAQVLEAHKTLQAQGLEALQQAIIQALDEP